MLRAVLGSVAVAAMCVGSLAAADKTNTASAQKANRECKAMFVSADAAHNTITFLKLEEGKKHGKGVEVTMPLAKNAKIMGENNKSETLAALTKQLHNKGDHPIMITEDKDGKQVTEVKDVANPKTK